MHSMLDDQHVIPYHTRNFGLYTICTLDSYFSYVRLFFKIFSPLPGYGPWVAVMPRDPLGLKVPVSQSSVSDDVSA